MRTVASVAAARTSGPPVETLESYPRAGRCGLARYPAARGGTREAEHGFVPVKRGNMAPLFTRIVDDEPGVRDSVPQLCAREDFVH
jgi:hypothetical protein